jgi:hypothetical protein
LPGSGFGQNGSGWNFGMPGWLPGCPIGSGAGCCAKAQPAIVAMAVARSSDLIDALIALSPLTACCLGHDDVAIVGDGNIG